MSKEGEVKTCVRVVEEQKLNTELLQNIFDELGVEPIGDISKPNEGRIATNLIQKVEGGRELMIRVYPKDMPEKLETGSPQYEIKALDFFSQQGVKVPKPVKFSDGSLSIETEDLIIFAYDMIAGEAIEQSALNPEIAAKIGLFLKDFVDASMNYKASEGEVPTNTFQYVLDIAERLENKVEGLKDWDKWISMKQKVSANVESVENTPAGIVHADFFFENILQTKSGDISALIDFGDAYYGRVIHDIVIAAMEASVNGDEIWDLNSFREVLKPMKDFLKSNNISFEQFHQTLEADCLRFAVYTIPFNIEENQDYHENGYVQRFEKISESDFAGELGELYADIIG